MIRAAALPPGHPLIAAALEEVAGVPRAVGDPEELREIEGMLAAAEESGGSGS